MRVAWFSAGVSSFVAAYCSSPDSIVYIDVADQHPDSMRFVKDCESILGQPIEIIRSKVYHGVEDVIRATRYINGPHGAPCTAKLKRDVRKQWEAEHPGEIIHIFGYEKDEQRRANRISGSIKCEFPLIERGLSKEDCHTIAATMGLKRPAMYEMGYRNNNCVGCVKGGMGYWNQIRRDFPNVFDSRAKLEREIGHSCINGVFLDELDPEAGRFADPVEMQCSFACLGFEVDE